MEEIGFFYPGRADSWSTAGRGRPARTRGSAPRATKELWPQKKNRIGTAPRPSGSVSDAARPSWAGIRRRAAWFIKWLSHSWSGPRPIFSLTRNARQLPLPV